MKIFILSILFSTSAFAQSYIEFDKYIHSKKINLRPSESIQEVLSQNGYDIQSSNKWINYTLWMNGLNKAESKQRVKQRELYLPPTISFQDYLNQKKSRKIASVRNLCMPLTETYLSNKFGKKSIPYYEFFKLITSRKVSIKKGQSISRIIETDTYRYTSNSKTIEKVMMANGIRTFYAKKDQTIYLPYCANDLNRGIASVQNKMSTKVHKTLKKEKSKNFGLGLIYGGVSINRDSKELSMNFTKLSGKYTYSFSDTYSLTTSFSIAKFTNLKHSDSEAIESVPAIYPEGSIQLNKKMNGYSLSLGYDIINYFSVNNEDEAIVLTPILNHRVGLRALFPISDKVALLASTGYLTSDNNNLSGFDYSIGMSYKVYKDLNVTGSAYQSRMKVLDVNTDESSSVWVISASYPF